LRRASAIVYRTAFAFAFVLSFACALTTTGARAGQTTVDLTVGPLIGTHAEDGSRDSVASEPVPILQLSHRESFAELFVEGLPVAPSIASTATGQSISTQLTFENILLRGYAFHDRLSLGVGETIYNQSSTYQPGGAIDASRVVGGRFEIAGQPLANRNLRVAFDLVPVLHGLVFPSFPNEPFERFDPAVERGTQTEFDIGYRLNRGTAQFAYGVRYINYVSFFTRTGELSDRNAGVLPYVSYGVRFGRS
jgi:hypothetical protein